MYNSAALKTTPTLMIIDDEIANLECLSSLFEKDYRIIGIAHAEAALEEAADYLPELILLDTQMPKIDGYEVCRQLKADIRTRHIPVILMGHMETKHSHVNSNLGLNLGAIDYINKPFNHALVVTRVKNHLLMLQKNTLLERQMMLDNITLIPNQEAFIKTLKTEWSRCTRSESPLSTIVIDIDMFRHYSDHYGHSAGNSCLATVAKTLVTCSKRPSDFIAHYDDKVFAAILSDADHQGALNMAEIYRSSIENLHLPHAYSGTSPYVTVSLGVATSYPNIESKMTAKSLLDCSYTLLQQAEKNGFNRVLGKQL